MRFAFLLMALLGAGGARLPAAAPPRVEEVLARMDDLYRSASSVARMEIEVEAPGIRRRLQVKAWTLGMEHALIVIEQPPREAGIATLRVKENLWNYLPRIDRTLRVPPSMMLGSWMGTDFSNDDLVKESSYRLDYDSHLAGRSEAPEGWLILGTVKPGIVGRWGRLDMVVDEAGEIPKQMRYYDRRGRLARILDFTEVRVLGGRKVPTRMTLLPQGAGEEGKRTTMRYLEIQFDAGLKEGFFSLSRLQRKR